MNIFSFLSSLLPKKSVPTSSTKKDKKKICKDKNITEPSLENDLTSSSEETNSIYYLPVHLM